MIHEHPKRKEIALRGHLFAERLFGRNIVRDRQQFLGLCRSNFIETGNSKVRNLHLESGSDKNIGGFQILMDHIFLVGKIQGFA